MGIEIDSLPSAISLDGTESVPIVQGGTTKRTTTAAIAAQTTPDLDTISSTQGAVLYRSATAWEALSPGTSGYLLQTQGAGANPAWAQAGTVFSVAISGGTTGISVSGSPITTSGTITLSGTLVAANGGTGIASYTIGDILYASGATALSKLAGVATGNALISGGVTTAPSWGKIGLTTHVDGTLPVANGGTALTAGTSGGVLAYTATGVLASSATLAANQIVIGGGAGAVPATLGSLGTTSTLLRGNAAGAPTWGALTSGDVTGALAYTPANKAGETFTGNINIDKAWPSLWLDADVGTSAYVFGVKNGSQRWLIELGNGVSESGSNVGTNFGIHRYSDAGAWLGAPFEINRATGVVSINGGVAWHSGNDGSGSGLDADLLDGVNGAAYALLASPTFTGTPAAPTAAYGTNTTQLATTAFVTPNFGRVSVKSYGAVGDGSTDDSAAIASARTSAIATGRALYFPASTGAYVTAGLELWADCVIVGDGPQRSMIKLKAASTTSVVYGTANRVTIRDLAIDGNMANCPSGGCGVWIYGFRPTISHVYIANCAQDGIYSDSLADTFNQWGIEGTFTNIVIDTVKYHGIRFLGPHDSYFNDVIIIDAGQYGDNSFSGLYVGPASNGRFHNIHPWSRSSTTYRMASAVNVAGAGCEFVNCHFEGSHLNALVTGATTLFQNCRFYAAWSGLNILLRAPFCRVSGFLGSPADGRPACKGIIMGYEAADNVSSCIIDIMASNQAAGLFDFTYEDGLNTILARSYNSYPNVGSPGGSDLVLGMN